MCVLSKQTARTPYLLPDPSRSLWILHATGDGGQGYSPGIPICRQNCPTQPPGALCALRQSAAVNAKTAAASDSANVLTDKGSIPRVSQCLYGFNDQTLVQTHNCLSARHCRECKICAHRCYGRATVTLSPAGDAVCDTSARPHPTNVMRAPTRL